MLCTTKDLCRNGYDTACCTFQLIELMRTMDTHKKVEKKCIEKPTKQNYFSDLQVLDTWDGNKQENWKKYRQAASFLCTALVTCQPRCHTPARSASTRVFETGFN